MYIHSPDLEITFATFLIRRIFLLAEGHVFKSRSGLRCSAATQPKTNGIESSQP